jgi:acyl carrier protein
MSLSATIDLIRAEIARTRGDGAMPDEIDATTTWHDLRCDPIDVLTIAHACEDAFDVRFPIEIEDCESVGALARMIEDLQTQE